MAEGPVDTGYARVQKENEEDALLLSPIAIWIHQLVEVFKTSPHDISLKNEIIENIRITLGNLSKARSGNEFYTDYCNHQKPAESYCRDCENFLDAPCVKFHKEIKFLIPHSVFNFMRRKVDNKHVLHFAPKSSCRIPGHNQKESMQNEILFYCQDCTMLLCRIGRRHHEGHICIALHKANEIKRMLSDIMQSCGQNPECQLKEIRDLTYSIMTSLFGVNLKQSLETLASIASSDSQTSDINLTGNGFAIHVPCDESNFTKSADMEKSTLPEDVQHSVDAFQDLHP